MRALAPASLARVEVPVEVLEVVVVVVVVVFLRPCLLSLMESREPMKSKSVKCFAFLWICHRSFAPDLRFTAGISPRRLSRAPLWPKTLRRLRLRPFSTLANSVKSRRNPLRSSLRRPLVRSSSNISPTLVSELEIRCTKFSLRPNQISLVNPNEPKTFANSKTRPKLPEIRMASTTVVSKFCLRIAVSTWKKFP